MFRISEGAKPEGMACPGPETPAVRGYGLNCCGQCPGVQGGIKHEVMQSMHCPTWVPGSVAFPTGPPEALVHLMPLTRAIWQILPRERHWYDHILKLPFLPASLQAPVPWWREGRKTQKSGRGGRKEGEGKNCPRLLPIVRPSASGLAQQESALKFM